MLKWKKGFTKASLLVAGIMLVSGCSAQQSNGSSDSSAQVQEKRPKVSIAMSQTSWGGEAIDPDLMDEVKKVIEDNTNTEIEMIAPPLSSYSEKLNVMLSSGQIPDVFAVNKAMDNIQIYAARGYTRALDEYIDGVAAIDSVVDPGTLDYLRVDGQLHALPRYVPMSKVIWARKDLFDQYGVNLSSTPTTEEFYTEMKKMANQDFVPFSFPKWLDNLGFFYNAFGAYGGIGVDENGKYYDGFNSPETKEALEYMHKLYKDGIWDMEFLTNENSTMREKLSVGRAASDLDYFNRFIYYSAESSKQNAETEFRPIYSLQGPNGGNGNLNEAIQVAMAVSAKSKVPEKAIEVISYLFYTEEGEKLGNLGIEGVHYNVENERLVPVEKAKNSGYKGTVDAFFLSLVPLPDFNFKWDDTTEKYLDQQIKINQEIKNHLGPKYLVPGEKSELYDRNQPSYKKKIEEIASKIILGGATVEQGFAEYEAFWKSIDGDKMLEELNQ